MRAVSAPFSVRAKNPRRLVSPALGAVGAAAVRDKNPKKFGILKKTRDEIHALDGKREKNGLLDFDHRPKFNCAAIRRINEGNGILHGGTER